MMFIFFFNLCRVLFLPDPVILLQNIMGRGKRFLRWLKKHIILCNCFKNEVNSPFTSNAWSKCNFIQVKAEAKGLEEEEDPDVCDPVMEPVPEPVFKPMVRPVVKPKVKYAGKVNASLSALFSLFSSLAHSFDFNTSCA